MKFLFQKILKRGRVLMSLNYRLGKDSLVVSICPEEQCMEIDPIKEDGVLRNQLLFGVTCGANIGGLFWPYGSVTSSVLYRLTKR